MLTPMMKQYLEMKEKYPGMILFFRLGDFYEMFFDDAKLVARELELTLTGKSCGLDERAPMCGVPFHSAETYINQLIEKGYKVAICEQMEDPATAKGLVKRDVIRVVTPGTVIETSMLSERRNNYILSVCPDGRRAGLAFCDVSTGEFYAYETASDAERLADEAARILPSEVIASEPLTLPGLPAVSVLENGAFAPARARRVLLEHFRLQTLAGFGLEGMRAAVRASGALMAYLQETQKNAMEHITAIRLYESGGVLALDQAARRSLELTESLRTHQKKHSLLGVLDCTCTAMGGRKLRSFIEQPLAVREAIEARLSAVQALKDDEITLDLLRSELGGVCDVERLLSRVAYRTVAPKDCLALCDSLSHVPAIRDAVRALRAGGILLELQDSLEPLEDVRDLLERAIDPDAPALMSDGRFIREGYSAELDGCRAASRDGKQWISDLEAKERELTGIRNLRIQYNRVFGYYIEVTKSNYAQVPYRYTRKQTLANCERYTTQELHEIEETVLGAQDKAVRLEQTLFAEIRDRLVREIPRLQHLSEGLKTLDALCALARAALRNGYVRPEITEDGVLEITGGRHPVVELSMAGEEPFVPNDAHLDTEDSRMMIITGPNMAGKSTYMRQTALIALMAHIGSFVPAERARVGVLDRIFTRIGASDDLAGGQSTFMVEMNEMAHILNNATSRSLVILDEVGRGTSTFDGLAIAWAIVEYMTDKRRVGAKTMFATHYHELSELEGRLEGVVNTRVSVLEHGEEIVFLRKVERGGSDRSFGIHVARLAGIPRPVVMRAHEILARLETNDENRRGLGQDILDDGSGQAPRQVNLFETPALALLRELQEMDVLAMTPIEALNALFTLKEKARRA